VLLVAVTVALSASAGVLCDRHAGWAGAAARGCLSLMLYVLVPFVSYVSFAHLRLSLGAGVGLGIAYIGLALAGTLAWWVGRRIGVPRPTLGGVILCAVIANTG
jgi:predicted permease